MAHPVNWFEIPVQDLRRAKKFYEALLDTELELNELGALKMACFPMNKGAPGASGALVKGDGYLPSHNGTLVYFSVKDIEDHLTRVKAHGGRILIPKTGIGDYGFIAHFEDTEGNRVALHAKS
jgi:predicted enzyme related to lactoylglutathione lyase